MSETKWYIISQSAEEESYFVIELTPYLAQCFRNVLATMEFITGGPWCGMTYMYEKGYPTRDDAIQAIKEMIG